MGGGEKQVPLPSGKANFVQVKRDRYIYTAFIIHLATEFQREKNM
jgi:hypothetical protein